MLKKYVGSLENSVGSTIISFQRAPQGYLKELFDSEKSIAHIDKGINPNATLFQSALVIKNK
jgi:hypothetical protein